MSLVKKVSICRMQNRAINYKEKVEELLETSLKKQEKFKKTAAKCIY